MKLNNMDAELAAALAKLSFKDYKGTVNIVINDSFEKESHLRLDQKTTACFMDGLINGSSSFSFESDSLRAGTPSNIDITANFNKEHFNYLHLLQPNHPALEIFKHFMKEAYAFKYDAIKLGYEPVYVLALFPDKLIEKDKVEWCMTIFKLPDGSVPSYGCECVKFEKVWKLNRNLIIDCYERGSHGQFTFTIEPVENHFEAGLDPYDGDDEYEIQMEDIDNDEGFQCDFHPLDPTH